VEAFVAPFSSSSHTVHFWVSQLRIVLPLLYVIPLFYLFIYACMILLLLLLLLIYFCIFSYVLNLELNLKFIIVEKLR